MLMGECNVNLLNINSTLKPVLQQDMSENGHANAHEQIKAFKYS